MNRNQFRVGSTKTNHKFGCRKICLNQWDFIVFDLMYITHRITHTCVLQIFVLDIQNDPLWPIGTPLSFYLFMFFRYHNALSVHWSVFVNILERNNLMNLTICLKMLFIEYGAKYCTWKTNGKYHTNQWLCPSALVTEWNLLLQQWNVREPFSLPTVVTASNPLESATITRVKRFVLHLPIKKGNRTDGFESNTPVEVNKGSIVQLSGYLAVVCLLGNVCAGFVVCWSCNDGVINFFFCCILFGCKKQQPLVPTPHLPGLRCPFRPIYHCFQAVPTWSLHLIPEFVCGIGRSRATRWGFFRGWQCLQQPGGRLKDRYRLTRNA